MTAIADPEVLFAYDTHHTCCDCCEGYCPLESRETPAWVAPRVEIEIDGVEYVGTNRLLIRKDALPELHASFFEGIIRPSGDISWATVPATRPPLTERLQVAYMADILERSGLTAHNGDEILHLYADENHVGWTKWARDGAGCRPQDLGIVRDLAQRIGMDIRTAHQVLLRVREHESGVVR